MQRRYFLASTAAAAVASAAPARSASPRDAEANKMFTRQYRAHFVVPAKV